MKETTEINDLRRRALARYLAAEGPTETYRARCVVRLVDALGPYLCDVSDAEDAYDLAYDDVNDAEAAVWEAEGEDDLQAIYSARAQECEARDDLLEAESAIADARDDLLEAVAIVEGAFDADDLGLRQALEALGVRDTATLPLLMEVA